LAIIIVALWGVSLLVEATVRGELMYYWGARRMEQRIAKLSDHYVICGFGRMGQEIAKQFLRSQTSFVVVEHNPEQLSQLEVSGYYYVKGDAREDEQLLRAGIQRAKGLVAVAATDEANVYITLSGRVLNPNLYIVTRCSHASGEAKLLHAGANRVFSPYVIGGRRMAQAIVRPSVVDFLDTVIHDEQMELVLEEVTLDSNAPIKGHATTGASDIESLGVHLDCITTPDGQMLTRNLGQHIMQVGDNLILLGEAEAMQGAIKQLTGHEKTYKLPETAV
jgi:voltage-gated potassium channel